MKSSFSLAGGMLVFHRDNGNDLLLSWSNASRGPELAVEHVLTLVSRGDQLAPLGLVSLCSFGFEEWVIFTVLAVCLAQLVEPAANACLLASPMDVSHFPSSAEGVLKNAVRKIIWQAFLLDE